MNLKSIIRHAFVVVLLSSPVFTICAQTVKHIVERGETLESIARNYGVTCQAIINLNPDAAQFVYVGMELVIPEQSVSPAPTSLSVRNQVSATMQSGQTNTTATEARVVNNVSISSDSERWSFAMDMGGYGFLDHPKGTHKSAFHSSMGMNYHITECLYASARLGYCLVSGWASGTEDGTFRKEEADIHMLSVPLELGYALQSNNTKLAIIPFAGPEMNIGLSGKNKSTEGNIKTATNLKYGGKIGLACRLGVRLRIYGVNISGSYHLPLNKKYQKFIFGKDAYPEISLGFGF